MELHEYDQNLREFVRELSRQGVKIELQDMPGSGPVHLVTSRFLAIEGWPTLELGAM